MPDRPSTVARKLRDLRMRAGRSMTDTAKVLGMPVSSYQHYEARYKKELIPVELVSKLIPFLCQGGVTEDEVASLGGVNFDQLRLGGEPIVLAPILSWVRAGRFSEALMTEDSDDISKVPVQYGRGSLFALRVQGESMNRIAPEGSHIIIDYEDRELVDGRYYVVSIDGEATFKRIRLNPLRLEPNSNFSEFDSIFPSNGMTVVGRVVKVIHDLP